MYFDPTMASTTVDCNIPNLFVGPVQGLLDMGHLFAPRLHPELPGSRGNPGISPSYFTITCRTYRCHSQA